MKVRKVMVISYPKILMLLNVSIILFKSYLPKSCGLLGCPQELQKYNIQGPVNEQKMLN